MIGDGDTVAVPNTSRRWLVPVALLLLAFLTGIVLTAVAVRRSARIAELLHPPAVVIARLPAAPPVVAPQRPREAALAERVGTLEQQVEAIDTRASEASGDADRAEGLLVAFAARRALDRGQPLGFLETLLRTHFGGVEPAAVAAVIEAAQRPVTLTGLRDSFDRLAPRLIAPPAREGLWTGLRREFGSLFVVRRSDTASTVPADRQERAAHALELGQVDLAMTEVARMPAAGAAAEWTKAARRYLLARSALDRIETAALLKPQPAPTPPPLPAEDRANPLP